MEKQVFDAEGIAAASTAIYAANDGINNAFFNPLVHQMLHLRDNWRGRAGEAAFNNRTDVLINSQNADRPSAFQRFDELKAVVTFLSEQVIPNYVQTETANKSLSDNFK